MGRHAAAPTARTLFLEAGRQALAERLAAQQAIEDLPLPVETDHLGEVVYLPVVHVEPDTAS